MMWITQRGLIGMVVTSLLPFTSVKTTPANHPSASFLKASSIQMSTLLELYASRFSMKTVDGDQLLLLSRSLWGYRTCLISQILLTLLRPMGTSSLFRIQWNTRDGFANSLSSIHHWFKYILHILADDASTLLKHLKPFGLLIVCARPSTRL